MPEPWGHENGLLYKYLDYIWRRQLFDKQVKLIMRRRHNSMIMPSFSECLVFHTGLQRRIDGKSVYLLLIPNDADRSKRVEQKWRVAMGTFYTCTHTHTLKKKSRSLFFCRQRNRTLIYLFVCCINVG